MLRRLVLHALLAAVTACAALACPARGDAQSEAELDRARANFSEGVVLTHDERWEEAANRFREVMRVRATAQVKWNLGLALSHTGELIEARRLIDEALAEGGLPVGVRRQARRLSTSLIERIPRVTISLGGELAGAEVSLDDAPLTSERVDTAFDLDPGDHRLVARRGGQVVEEEAFTLEEGGGAEVRLVVPAPVLAAAEIQDPALAVSETSSGGVATEWWFWTALGGAVAVVIGAAIIGASVAGRPQSDPIRGTLGPGVIEVMP